MKPGSRDEQGTRLFSEQQFRDGAIQVLVATEAAGEGINLQVCNMPLITWVSPFGIADVEQLCANVSRDTIRRVMNRWREQGRLEMLGKGRDAKWRRKS
jgi:RecG-like helicase